MDDIRNGRCPLCEHNEIIAAIPAEFGNNDYEVKAAITYDARWALPGRNPRSRAYGALTTYTCRSCGFVQSFADDPGEIPIDDAHRTRLIRGPNVTGAFR
jgi:rubrerythrin